MSRIVGMPDAPLPRIAMNVSPVVHLEENGVHIVSFLHDQQGQANTDLVLSYFAGEFLPSTAGYRRLVIDLTGVTSPALKEIFALTRFDKVFPIYATRAEAIAAVRGPGAGKK